MGHSSLRYPSVRHPAPEGVGEIRAVDENPFDAAEGIALVSIMSSIMSSITSRLPRAAVPAHQRQRGRPDSSWTISSARR
jgi:hypothetical protein